MTQRDAYHLKRRLDLGKPSPGKPQSAQQSQTQVFSPAFIANCDVIDFWTLALPALKGEKASDWLQPTRQLK